MEPNNGADVVGVRMGDDLVVHPLIGVEPEVVQAGRPPQTGGQSESNRDPEGEVAAQRSLGARFGHPLGEPGGFADMVKTAIETTQATGQAAEAKAGESESIPVSELTARQLRMAGRLAERKGLKVNSEAEAVDSAVYATTYFMPAMRRAMNEDPGRLRLELTGADGSVVGEAAIDSDHDDPDAEATVRGPATQVLLGLWGRPHGGVEVTAGEATVWDACRDLPGRSHQFGTWD